MIVERNPFLSRNSALPLIIRSHGVTVRDNIRVFEGRERYAAPDAGARARLGLHRHRRSWSRGERLLPERLADNITAIPWKDL